MAVNLSSLVATKIIAIENAEAESDIKTLMSHLVAHRLMAHEYHLLILRGNCRTEIRITMFVWNSMSG